MAANNDETEANSGLDVHELGERVGGLRSRFDEFRGRL
jgi:hypothetical protein